MTETITMNTHKLKPAIEYILTAPNNVDGVDARLDTAWAIYDVEVTPSSVIAMISDIDRLKDVNFDYQIGADAASAEIVRLQNEIVALRTALTTIRDVSPDTNACVVADAALVSNAIMQISEEKSKVISQRGRDALVNAMSREASHD